jgi:probable phosphoglycerate mutase
MKRIAPYKVFNMKLLISIHKYSKLVMKTVFLILLLLLLSCVKEETGEQTDIRDVTSNSLNVFIVRHAEAYKNLPNPADISSEILDSLTSRGIKQAIAAGKILKDRSIIAIFTSPTGRTQQTAAIIAKRIGLTHPPEINVAFSSLKKGKTSDGESVTWSWREKQWQAGHDPRPQGGESLKDGMDRASHAIEELTRRHPGKAVVIVTHSDICAALIGRAENTPPAECYRKHKIPLGSTSEISISLQTWKLKSQGVVSEDF